MSDYLDKLERIELEKRTLHSIAINEELMEHLDSTIRWLLHYCDKNDIRPPNMQLLSDAIQRSQNYIQMLPTDQPTGNTTNNYRGGNSTG